MAKTAAERKADARDRKRAQRQREREAASIAAVSGRRRITFEVSDHIFEQIKANCSARRPGKNLIASMNISNCWRCRTSTN